MVFPQLPQDSFNSHHFVRPVSPGAAGWIVVKSLTAEWESLPASGVWGGFGAIADTSAPWWGPGGIKPIQTLAVVPVLG